MPVPNQAERGANYATYVTEALASPEVVGVHWFAYADEPTAGRSGDGENGNFGFVSITNTPYYDLIAAARGVNARAYAIHSQAR